jgi:hypothetical protein
MEKIFKKLNGYKSHVAHFYWITSASIIAPWFPGGLPDQWNKVYLTVGIILTSIGWGHKAIKKISR